MGSGSFGVFDFGLDQAEEERAARLHAESVIIDILYQGPAGYRYYDAGMEAEIEAKLQKHHHPFMSYLDGLWLPIERQASGQDGRFRQVWEASGITGGNR